jgi:hypothetical protein
VVFRFPSTHNASQWLPNPRAAKLGQKTRKEIYDALKRCGLDAKGWSA